ncbi:hypothetical protein [uncultured Caulobacter sp.]|uniref:hypothetical protein n=1 Tax=uncultured Caulobacter sp. TaxID=158749 RepID=UPI00262F4161|nr:hypothetical protein [uncultured Caulobacter sp.]
MKHPLLLPALLLGLAVSSSAWSAGAKEDVFQPGKPLLAQIQKIEAELNDGKTYAELGAEERSRVRETLGRLRLASERYPDGAPMPESARTQVINDQEIVNTVLTQAREDSRLICRREKAIGSNMPQTQCMTVAERARRKEHSQGEMQRLQRIGPKEF